MLLNLWVQGLMFISVVYNPVLTANPTLKLLIVEDPSHKSFTKNKTMDEFQSYNFENRSNSIARPPSTLVIQKWIDPHARKYYNFQLSRHGDRRPERPHESYATDPHKNKNFDGKLTESGKKRELDLGKFLRSTYNSFLGPSYIPGCIEAKSTNVDRTKESANLILKGLYPGAVIPVTSVSKLKDTLFFPQLCPEYVIGYLAARVDSTGELKKLEVSMKNLSKWTGQKINSALNMYLLYTTLDAEKFMNLKLPSWTNGTYPDGDILKGALLELHIMNYNENMRKRNGGTLIKQFKEDMESVESGKMNKNRRVMLYVAHDLNIVAVLKALGVFYPHVPKYSASLMLELHLIAGTYYVMVNYFLGVPATMSTLQIPKCVNVCPFNQFSTLMKNVIPSGLELLCDKIRGLEILSKEFPDVAEKFKQKFSE